MSTEVRSIELEPADNERLANLCGPLDEHLRELERRLAVTISNEHLSQPLTFEIPYLRAD